MPRHFDNERSAGPDLNYQMELGTRGILILFASVAVICGLFFAFGYTIGKHAVPTSFSLGDTTNTAAPLAGSKPSPASPLPTSSDGAQPPNPSDLSAVEQNLTPATLDGQTAARGTAAVGTAATTPVPVSGSPAHLTPTAATSSAAPTAGGLGPGAAAPVHANATAIASSGYAVQVFAGAKEGDALALAAALKARQYPVFVVRPEQGGGLFRVQVGPYASLPEAQAMRSRLSGDGYAAIIKH